MSESIKILCTSCFDLFGCERILAVITQSTCQNCGRECLGYETEIDAVTVKPDEVFEA